MFGTVFKVQTHYSLPRENYGRCLRRNRRKPNSHAKNKMNPITREKNIFNRLIFYNYFF